MGDARLDLSTRLDAVRQRVRKLFIVHGIAQLGVCLVGFLIATFLIDYTIPAVPAGVRILFLFAGIGGLAYGIWRFVLYPLSVQITDDDIALCLERQYPKLRDRLISSIQLSRSSGTQSDFNSSELVQALIAETATLTDRLDFQAVVLPQVPQKRARVAAGALVGLLALGLLFPQIAGIYVQRLFGSDVRWPRKTILVVNYPSEVVAKGEDFVVTVTVREGSRFPAKAYLSWRFASGLEDTQRMAKVPDQDAYRFELHRVAEDFTFSVTGGDDQSPWHEIKVVTPLRIDHLGVFFTYPAYMKLKNTPADKPEDAGNLKLPIGTKVTLRATANAPLSRAQLLFGRRGQEQSSDLAISADANGNAVIGTGEFTVSGDSEYSVVVTGTNDLTSRNPPRYLIKVIVDNGPALKVNEPSGEKSITPQGTIPIRTATKDDFGIYQIRVHWSFANREKAEEIKVPFEATHNDADYGSREINSHFDLDLPSLAVKEGDIISFHIEAEDNCEFPAHNITKSRKYTFTVVSKATLEAQLDERRMKIKDELKKTLENQEKQRQEVERLSELLAGKENLERAERRSLATAAAGQQKQVAQHLERLVHEVDEVLKDVDNNKLWDMPTREKLSAMRETLQEDASKKSPEASTALSQASQSNTPQSRFENMEQAGAKQEEIAADLRSVLDKMEEWEDYMEVVKIVRELVDRQNQINEDIRRGSGKSK